MSRNQARDSSPSRGKGSEFVEQERTEEDKIIETIVLEGKSRMYEDLDFLPIRQSLYNVQTIIPDYDLENSQYSLWCRPKALSSSPDYFTGTPICAFQGSLHDEVFMGTLLAVAIYPHSDLLQNIFASRVDDFKEYGVYTCRFYVNGEWVEVITDTQIPCVRDPLTDKISPVYSRAAHPNEFWVPLVEKAYAKAVGSYEAIHKIKYHEALVHLTGGSTQHVYLQGSAEGFVAAAKKAKEMAAGDDGMGGEVTVSAGHGGFFNPNLPGEGIRALNEFLLNDAIVVVMPLDTRDGGSEGGGESNAEDSNNAAGSTSQQQQQQKPLGYSEIEEAPESNFLPNRLYSVIMVKDVQGVELVLLHNPWGAATPCWNGEWSDRAGEWDQFPEVLAEIENDRKCPWRRKSPNGYFWMTTRNFIKFFNSMYICKLFPNEKFSFYCVRGEWLDRTAGGAPHTVRDINKVAKEAAESRVLAIQKATAAVVIDGDSSWFNNPQFMIKTSPQEIGKPPPNPSVFISLIPLGGGASESDSLQVVTFSITSHPKSKPIHPHLWELAVTDIVASDKLDDAGRIKGQEASLWSFTLDPHNVYRIVPQTLRRGIKTSFLLRVYSTEPIIMERIDPLYLYTMKGEWRKHGDLDSMGGGLYLPNTNTNAAASALAGGAAAAAAAGDGALAPPPSTPAAALATPSGQPGGGGVGGVGGGASASVTLKENTKWCQNPQFHLEIINPFRQDEIHLKIVLRRTDKGAHQDKKGAAAAAAAALAGWGADPKAETTVGLVICKATCLVENVAKSKRGALRQTPMGDLLPVKASSLKKKKVVSDDTTPVRSESGKTVLRTTSVLQVEGGREGGQGGVGMYYATSTFSSKGEAVIYYPRIPRSWIPNGLIIVPCLSAAGAKGSFDLDVFASEPITLNQLPEAYSRTVAGEWVEGSAGGSHLGPTWKKNPKYSLKLKASTAKGAAPARVRITLSRTGSQWRTMAKKDTVGCMIGFYIFLNRGGELTQIYDAPFVPDDSISTESNFVLEILNSDEEYVIMPTTFKDGVFGSFVLAIIAEYEFSLIKQG